MGVKNKMIKISKYLLILALLLYGGNVMAGWDFMFFNKAYKDKIKIKAYLASEDKISNIFVKDNKMEKIVPMLENYQELFGKKTYLIIQLKNEGRLSAWGILACATNNYSTKVYVNRVPFQEWDTYIIPIGVLTWNRNDIAPIINVEWEKLYTK